MISFFRKIRQNLLAQGRVARYITNAISEIMLVLNWNLIAHRFPRPLKGRACTQFQKIKI